jgi:hypothetical protein
MVYACGGHILTEHPQLGLIDVYAAVIPASHLAASVHVNYRMRALVAGRAAEAEGLSQGDGVGAKSS